MIGGSSSNDGVERDLPWFEDVMKIYQRRSFENTFHSTDFTTFFVVIIHIIGVTFLYMGILLPPEYLWTHMFYGISLMISYIVFDQNCFMTLFANKAEQKDISPLYVRMKTAASMLLFFITVSTVGYLFPSIAPFTILKRIILSLDPSR